MTTVICFANNKGGSGKSTTCANVGYSMAAEGKKVLLIDGDMQMNLTLSFFDDEASLEMAKNGENLYTAVTKQRDLAAFIKHTEYEGLDIIPSSTLMSGIEFELFTMWQRELILRQGLKAVKESGKYDYILIDAPPTLGCWVMNILCASDFLIIPVEASPWGLFGLANMFEFCEKVKRISPDLTILGVAVTKVNDRKNYFKQTIDVLSELEQEKNIRLFRTYIRIDSTIEKSQDESKPVMAYKKVSRAAQEYMALAKEVMEYAHR
ncbi:MAG: AAA family ATPase [Clostridia bacterium]|nr:AAA family ATPase [Clostridia bacterium]